MQNIVWVFIGGGLGSLMRYGTTTLAARAWGTGFPWGTLLANLSGCFLIGIIVGLAERSEMISPAIRLFLLVGFLGGLTTFSTYSLETINAGRAGETMAMFANIMVQNVAGLALVAAGMLLIKLIK